MSPLDPALLNAFHQFVARRGADFTMRLLESLDDKVDPAKPNLIFRSIALLPLWSNLRYLSDMALENVVSCTEQNLPFSVLVECSPDVTAAGDRVNVTCYPGDEWAFKAKKCREARVYERRSTLVQDAGKRSSPNPLPSRGPRH